MPLKSRTEPLSSNSKHGRDEESKSKFLDDWTKDKQPFPVPKFLRDTLTVKDISGTSPRVIKKELPSQKYSDRGTPQRAGSVPPRDPLLEKLLPKTHNRGGSGIPERSGANVFRRPLDNSLCRADIPGTYTTPLPEFKRPTNFVEDISSRRSRSRPNTDCTLGRELFGLEQLPDPNKSILKFIQLSDLKALQSKMKEREELGKSLAEYSSTQRQSADEKPSTRRDRAERHRRKQTEQSLQQTEV